MQIDINVVAVSKETDGADLADINAMAANLVALSGKYAGTCYAPEGYETIRHQPIRKALARAEGNARRGHHSVFQHSVLSFEITCSKMICMILNSMGVSNASEKSARYTFMAPEQPIVDRTYRKWLDVFGKLVPEYLYDAFPDGNPFTASEVEKMILDQARYSLSVFTPTNMVYSIPYRNLCYLVEWMRAMSANVEAMIAADPSVGTWFHRKLRQELLDTSAAFESVLGESLRVKDNKQEYLRFLPYQAIGDMNAIEREIYGDVYSVSRVASMACVAHVIRHRTLMTWIGFDGHPGKLGFYVPPLLERPGCEGLRREWLADMDGIAQYCPQGTLVRMTQQGSFDKLVLMAKERMCGRALLETQNVVSSILGMFSPDDLSAFNRKALAACLGPDGKPCARCRFDGCACTDGCKWGGKRALTKLV